MELQEVLEKRKSVRRHYLQKPVERKLILLKVKKLDRLLRLLCQNLIKKM